MCDIIKSEPFGNEQKCMDSQGAHKVGEKIPEFSRHFQSHKLTFPAKSKCNNDLHQGSFQINSSNITGQQMFYTNIRMTS